MNEWVAHHTHDGDPEEETLLELHLVVDAAENCGHYHSFVKAHDGLRPHQHRLVISRFER